MRCLDDLWWTTRPVVNFRIALRSQPRRPPPIIFHPEGGSADTYRVDRVSYASPLEIVLAISAASGTVAVLVARLVVSFEQVNKLRRDWSDSNVHLSQNDKSVAINEMLREQVLQLLTKTAMAL
jgi:hypothetical protein